MPPRRKGLAIVPPGTTAPPEPPKTDAPPNTLEAAIARTERDLLVATRRTLAATIDAGPPAHAVAGLARSMLEVDQKIRAIDARGAEDGGSNPPVEDGAFDASAV